MKIKQYIPSNKKEVLKLLRANTPAFFDASEESDFENYLDNEIEDYYIVLDDSQIIGVGGINYFPSEKLARLAWDIVLPKAQGKGVGKALTKHRLQHINRNPQIETIIVRTSQLAYKFYEKMGFEIEKIEKDYWAKNFDLYQMRSKKQ